MGITKIGKIQKCGCCNRESIDTGHGRKWCDFCNKWYDGTVVNEQNKHEPVYKNPVKGNMPNPMQTWI